MKRLRMLMLGALALLPIASIGMAAPSKLKYERGKQFSVQIKIEEFGYSRFNGSGFVFEHDGEVYVGTALHVVDSVMGNRYDDGEWWDNYGIIVKDPRGNEQRVLDVTTLDYNDDDKLDFALLKVEDVSQLYIGEAPKLAENPSIGEDIYSVGNTTDYFNNVTEWTYTEGYIASRWIEGVETSGEDFYGDVLKCDMTGHPGYSGSGVFNDNIEIVGVLVSGNGTDTISWLVASDLIIKALDQMNSLSV